jgi:hypothetical protein
LHDICRRGSRWRWHRRRHRNYNRGIYRFLQVLSGDPRLRGQLVSDYLADVRGGDQAGRTSR